MSQSPRDDAPAKKHEASPEVSKIELLPLETVAPRAQGADAVGGPRIGRSLTVLIEDEEIYCRVCDYNLTGVSSGRCPECGAYFDRQALVAARQGNTIVLIPWDDPEPMPRARRFYETLKVCLGSPGRFAYAFSVQPKQSRAFSFFMLVTFLTAFMAIAGFLLHRLATPQSLRPGPSGIALAADILAIAVCVIGNAVPTVLTAVVLWVFCPHYDGKRHFTPWLSIAAYAAAHWLALAVFLPIVLAGALASGSFGADVFGLLGGLGSVTCGLVCWVTMREVVDLRTPARTETRFVLFLLIVVYVVVPGTNVLVCSDSLVNILESALAALP